MEAVSASETSVNFCQITQWNISEDSHLQSVQYCVDEVCIPFPRLNYGFKRFSKTSYELHAFVELPVLKLFSFCNHSSVVP
jgi:hypothetical protein